MKVFTSLALSVAGLSFGFAQEQQSQSTQTYAADNAQTNTVETAPQPPPQPPTPAHVALRVVGSHVFNGFGERLGRIEEVLVNRTAGSVDYAVVAPSFPTNSSKLVPIPWSLLTYAWDQSRVGGPAGANQVFIAQLDPRRLASAPGLDRSRTNGVDPALAAAASYFGAPAVGGTGSDGGSVTGAGAGPAVTGAVGATTPAANGTASAGNQAAPQAIPGYGYGYPGFLVLNNGTNGQVITNNPGNTNVTGTNVTGSPNTNVSRLEPGAPLPGFRTQDTPRLRPPTNQQGSATRNRPNVPQQGGTATGAGGGTGTGSGAGGGTGTGSGAGGGTGTGSGAGAGPGSGTTGSGGAASGTSGR